MSYQVGGKAPYPEACRWEWSLVFTVRRALATSSLDSKIVVRILDVMKTAHTKSVAQDVHSLLVALGHSFAVDPLYNLGHADMWRHVIVAKDREQMIAALSYVKGTCEALQHLPSVPHNGVTYWRLHQSGILAALLLDHLLFNEPLARFDATIKIALETLIPFAGAEAETHMCTKCHQVVEVTHNFSKSTNTEEAQARAEWERTQATQTTNGSIAAAHLRTAHAFDVLSGERKAS
jgi:hypothetical protein